MFTGVPAEGLPPLVAVAPEAGVGILRTLPPPPGAEDEEKEEKKKKKKKSSNSDSSDSDNRRRVSEVKLLPFPKIGQLPAWQAALRTACADAAYSLDESEIIIWLQQAELDTTTFEDLRQSGKKFVQLDRRLAHALKKYAKRARRRPN